MIKQRARTLAMESTLNSNILSSASKLPVKRRTPEPNPQSSDDARAPPFKFHRIWTEADEIRFLQGLLDCSSQNLAFPRDLGIPYTRFCSSMSRPYTKSQLSEKLRRLRKKFRITSTRLSKGLERSQLSLHDRALYDLSKQLWHPEYAATFPFNGARNVGLNHKSNDSGSAIDGKLTKSDLVGIKVDFSPTSPVAINVSCQEKCGNDVILDFDRDDNGHGDGEQCRDGFEGLYDEDTEKEQVNLCEVNIQFEGEEAAEDDDGNDASGGGLGALKLEARRDIDFCFDYKLRELAAKAVINVFDECFKDVKRRLLARTDGDGAGLESSQLRWQQQKIAELDVLGGRLRFAEALWNRATDLVGASFAQPVTWNDRLAQWCRARFEYIYRTLHRSKLGERLNFRVRWRQRQQARAFKRTKPPRGWVKLDINGNSRGNPGPFGEGGVIMNSVGDYLAAFSATFGVGTSNEAGTMGSN